MVSWLLLMLRLLIAIVFPAFAATRSTLSVELPFTKILLNHAGPHALLVARRAGKAVSGQVDQIAAITQREKVEFAGASRHFAGEGEASLSG